MDIITLDTKCQAVIEQMREHGHTFSNFMLDGTKYELVLADDGSCVTLNKDLARYNLKGVRTLSPCVCGNTCVHTHE